MKVLYVTARPPYPPHKGDQLIAFEQLRNLSGKNHEIYLVCIISSETEKEAVISKLEGYCKKIYFLKSSKVISFLSILKTLFNHKPLQVNMYTDVLKRIRINEILGETKPDVIHIQTIRLADLFLNKKIPKVLDMIDVLSLNMERRAAKEKYSFKKIFQAEAFLLRKYEAKIMHEYDQVSVVSENDLIHSDLAVLSNVNVNPNGTSIIDNLPSHFEKIQREDAFLFHGNMGYFPNVEAMLYFVKEIWPEIRVKYPNYRLFIAGKDPAGKILEYDNKENIVVTGFVNDIREYLYRAKIGIYPLNSGTGMQNKILEALACGLPSIASNFAIQGIKAISSNEIIIANTKEEYLNAINTLVEDCELRQKYESNGQKFICENYSWSKNVNRLVQIWEKAVGGYHV